MRSGPRSSYRRRARRELLRLIHRVARRADLDAHRAYIAFLIDLLDNRATVWYRSVRCLSPRCGRRVAASALARPRVSPRDAVIPAAPTNNVVSPHMARLLTSLALITHWRFAVHFHERTGQSSPSSNHDEATRAQRTGNVSFGFDVPTGHPDGLP